VPEVLAVSVHEDAAVATHVLRVPATEVRVEEEGVRDTSQRLYSSFSARSKDTSRSGSPRC
jgi:hypothetical protein